MSHRIGKGTTLPVIEVYVTDEATGQPVSFAGAVSIRFRRRPANAASPLIDKAATSPAPGYLRYGPFDITETATEGEYLAWFFVDFGAGSTLVTEIVESEVFDNTVVVPAPTDTFGPCAPWCSTDDVQLNCPNYADDERAPTMIECATYILYELSARQFPGVCSTLVRPCNQQCGCNWLGNGYLWAGGDVYLRGWGPGGYWVGECGTQCGCGSVPEVVLDGFPVQAITQILIDGAVVDPATYRLDGNERLVRVSPNAQTQLYWPWCQDLALPTTQPGTWSVAYTYGTLPPVVGKQAAAQLACHLLALTDAGDCALPVGTTQIQRQGLTIQRELLATFKASGSTGLVMVDAFIAATNPGGWARPPSVFSPDRPNPRRI